jgi:signal transduction histidine kinase
MLLPASAEFVDLCRTQMVMLVQSLGASLIAIYLTEDPTASGKASLVPLVLYPEELNHNALQLPALAGQIDDSLPTDTINPKALRTANVLSPVTAPPPPETATKTLQRSGLRHFRDPQEPSRMVLPLMHENLIWGILVAGREGRRWTKREQNQLKQTASTLAIACVMDQRAQFLAQRQDQHRQLQGQNYDRFSMLLHQVRNPLTTLRTLGKLLLKRLQPEDGNRALVETIVEESHHLDSLLQQFDQAIDLGEASLENIEEQDMPQLVPMVLLPSGKLNLQPCWLEEVLHPILSAIAGRLDEKQIQMTLAIPAELPSVQADPAALREIFGNLIDNAVKYTATGGGIQISVERLDDAVQHPTQVTRISDTGYGIPPEDLERIFVGHYRGIQAHTDIPGTGLGLAIAQQLLTQMGGTIQALSPAIDHPPVLNPESKGVGSTFVVTLIEQR